ncbi:class I poly(R)-hydroxyalkanoic acid synthase [Sphingomonas ginkgonis]|uniref:Class I poly(R)-hydroxyalkanoic acid synthase n=1 Tax=Sphingomonas ginkgonis TaxID=2315330 RepID=A0A429VDH3_9SPHN|nr:class I poly(R)-hydroxyalkanoic acid synthase [Sphingomonas ginkgonis]RST31983.1 class I poly(R)-hydroxyalkanoic acid synthase [Sphingomonas ginkgonis]
MDETTTAPNFPTLEDWQHWTLVMGRAQQMMMETWAESWKAGEPFPGLKSPSQPPEAFDLMRAGAEAWSKGLQAWGQMLGATEKAAEAKDRRFAAPEWRDNPLFDTICQSYLAVSDQLMRGVEEVEGIDEGARQKLRFATKSFIDAMSPSNFALTNPQVLKKTIDSRGENLLNGLRHMLDDIRAGQLTQTRKGEYEVGRNLATTPGKVVKETPLYQLIQYTPTTDKVLTTPVVIFPPWINRFYILDLTPEKSFVRWCVEQGISLFMVSWKSADESMKDVVLDDYVLRGQVDAVDTIRDLLGVESVHTIGYCVAGTTLAATLAYLQAKGEAAKVRSATFFTAQIDFTQAGDLKLFLGDEVMGLHSQLTAEKGFLDGRYMAATFNALRGRDLVWNYVVNNYLLGEEPAPFDLLHWNSDTTNLPAKWHRDYLETLYKQNKLVECGGVSIDRTPVDLKTVRTPSYIQAGREDHIAPPESVWKVMDHFAGPKRFVLAGSGHIAGVVNPPSAQKYQYWTCDQDQPSLDEFIAHATEHKGSWWPDWVEWIRSLGADEVPATGARQPGEGKLPALEEAPGRYVRTR